MIPQGVNALGYLHFILCLYMPHGSMQSEVS